MRRRHFTSLLACLLFAATNLQSIQAQVHETSQAYDSFGLSSQQINHAFRDMRDRREQVRARALEMLVNTSEDLSSKISDELQSEQPLRVRNALKLIEAKKAYAECADFLTLLSLDDSATVDQTLRTLRAFDHTQLTSLYVQLEDSSFNDETKTHLSKTLEHESRYAAAYAVVALVSAPGHFDGQYSDLLSVGDWAVQALGDLIMLSDEIESPLQQAVMDFAESARHIEHVDASLIRLLAHGTEIPRIIPILRGESNDSISGRPMHYAAEIVARMRNRSARALGSSPSADSALEVLEAAHLLLADTRDDASFDLEITLLEEIEVSMACLGEENLLQRRLSGLRLVQSIHDDIDLPALGMAKNNDIAALQGIADMSLPQDEMHPDIRKKVAYLHLRAGQLDQAILEYTLLIGQLERDASQFNGDVAVATYNLACAYARKGLTSQAFERLKQAVTFGYDTFHHYEWMLLDGDISSVRSTQAFADWFKDVAPPYLLRQYEETRSTLVEKTDE